jgi:hypothetical protein
MFFRGANSIEIGNGFFFVNFSKMKKARYSLIEGRGSLLLIIFLNKCNN